MPSDSLPQCGIQQEFLVIHTQTDSLEAEALVSEFVSSAKQVRKVLWTRKGVRATVVTAGHCTYAELTCSGHALTICYSCCVHSRGLC